MTSRTDKMSADNIHPAYMRQYRKRKRIEEDNCNSEPKRKKLHAERLREYGETYKNLFAEYMHKYRKRKLRKTKHHKHLRQLALHQLQLYTIINKQMNTFKRILFVIHLVRL
jgi:hypothetical protein